MRKSVLLGLLLMGTGLLKAQYEVILNDPDVIWAAEIDLTFWIEPEFNGPDSVDSPNNYSTLLKLNNRAENPGDESQILLATHLFELITDENRPVFAHPDSFRALTGLERDLLLNIKDTITTFDPETFKEATAIVYNCWGLESLAQIRVRQILFYRDKSDEFELYTYAFAPIIMRNYGSDLVENWYPYAPFWFKMPPYRGKKTKVISLEDDNISLARRMRTGTNMPPLDSLRPYKDFKRPIMQQYLNRLQSDPEFKVRDGFDWSVMPLETRKSYLSRTDTVVTFDPETYEEKVEVVHISLQGQEVMKLRLVQDWLWDDRLQYPIFQLYAFAPMQTVRDQNGNPRFDRPIFWRLVRD